MGSVFTVDWEDWFDALHIDGEDRLEEPTDYLLRVLDEHEVRAVFFILGKTEDRRPDLVKRIKGRGHFTQSHGYFHIRGESADRQPYAWLGFTGGFYFRAFPYSFIKSQVISNGQFYIHPHDLDEGHPELQNPIMNWKRHVWLGTARKKLERLLSEIEWE